MRQRAAVPALVVCAAFGVGVLAAPDLLGLAGPARLSQQVVGPVVAALAVIATEPAVRLLARLNVVPGAWLVAAPLIFDHGGWWWASVLAGATVALLSLVPVSRASQFGGGWAALWRRAGGQPPTPAGR